MNMTKLIIFFLCVGLAACDVVVSTDKQAYEKDSVVISTIQNNSNATIFVNGCNDYLLKKRIINGEVVVDEKVCVHNIAQEILPGESSENTFVVSATGDYRVVYSAGTECQSGSELNSCALVEDYSSDFNVFSNCSQEESPVCGTQLQAITCVTQPCNPIEIKKTYGNECKALAAGSLNNTEGACGPVVCTMQYEPVCAIVNRPTFCITTPCPQNWYQTFGNSCSADGAPIVLNSECGALEDTPAYSISMVPLALARIARGDDIQLNKLSIRDHLLTMNVSYSGGCRAHEFNLIGDTALFIEGGSVSDQVILTHNANGDNCESYITEDISFDLNPLRETYLKTVGSDEKTGAVELQITVPASIPEFSKRPLILHTVDYAFDILK